MSQTRKPRTADHPTALDTEERILAAARVVFTRSGTAAARMQDIAREAGVNQALLHYYFRTKQALADRVLREAATALFAALPRTIRPDAPLEDVLRAFVHQYIDAVRRTPFLPAYVAAEAHHDPARVARIIHAVTGVDPTADAPRVLDVLQTMIDARVAAGEMRPIRARQMLVSVISTLAFPFITRRLLSSVYGTDDEAFEAFLDERRDDLPRFLLNALRA